MSRHLALLAVVVALAACGPSRYVKPGITQSEADLDARYCRAVARGGGDLTGAGLANIVSGAEAQAARYEACMLQKGYRPVD